MNELHYTGIDYIALLLGAALTAGIFVMKHFGV